MSKQQKLSVSEILLILLPSLFGLIIISIFIRSALNEGLVNFLQYVYYIVPLSSFPLTGVFLALIIKKNFFISKNRHSKKNKKNKMVIFLLVVLVPDIIHCIFFSDTIKSIFLPMTIISFILSIFLFKEE